METSTASVPMDGDLLASRARWINILPIAFIMYTISYFDRANIGLALPYMIKELHLTPTEAGLAGGVFSWGYAATQLAAGWIVLRVGARNAIGSALILWGFGAIGTAFVHNLWELLVMRMVLGVFEGPVFAATSVLLSQWFMKPERGRAFGIWNLSSPVGAFLAGPISGLILAQWDWHVMMIVEGLPAWIWAALWWWRIPASMEKASWLSVEERTSVQRVLAGEQASLKKTVAGEWWTVLASPAVWFTLIGFALVNLLISGFTLWLPSALKTYEGLSIVTIGLVSGLPFVAAMAGIYVISRHSDRHGQERRWHAALPSIVTGVLMIVAAWMPASAYVVQIVLFVVLGFTMKMFLPLVFVRLTEIMPKDKAVPAIAIVSGVGNLIGGFFGPLMIGYLWQHTGNFGAAFVALGLSGVLGGVALALVREKH